MFVYRMDTFIVNHKLFLHEGERPYSVLMDGTYVHSQRGSDIHCHLTLSLVPKNFTENGNSQKMGGVGYQLVFFLSHGKFSVSHRILLLTILLEVL